MYKDFHDRCNNRGPTISLFKIKDGDCIGGFTSVKWSCDRQQIGDNTAVLFNLSSSRYFPSKKTGKDIYRSGGYGPCFRGSDSDDLSACFEPFNADRNCRSCPK